MGKELYTIVSWNKQGIIDLVGHRYILFLIQAVGSKIPWNSSSNNMSCLLSRYLICSESCLF